MWKRKIEFKPSQTPEQHAYGVRWNRREDARRARLCDLLQFWRLCAKPLCRRRHACSHDPQACFARHWHPLPEADKTWVRALITGASGGVPAERLIAHADAEVERAAELERNARRAMEPAPPAVPPRDEPPTPRVRRL